MPKRQAISKAIKYLQAEGINIPPELLPVDDTYEQDAGLLEIDFHYELNTIGSNTITEK